jgi:agmatinase
MDIQDKIAAFDPSGQGDMNGTIYGLPFDESNARLVILPIPWEVTVSYRAGTAKAPEAVFDASFQVDLYDPAVKDAWKMGIAMKEINPDIIQKNEEFRALAEVCIEQHADGLSPATSAELTENLNKINHACAELNQWVKKEALALMAQGRTVALLGGDHSTPLGLMQALATKYTDFGILHIDAHADLRVAYEGFDYSHASIMNNALQIPQISRLVQVGIRDYCEAEALRIETDARISAFFSHELSRMAYEGNTWSDVCTAILEALPHQVYISFDIDGLDPKLCPNTGTPVPGGLEYEQAVYLISRVVESGREIIGFDLNEVAPGDDEWDANVGARLLYRLSNFCLQSQENRK